MSEQNALPSRSRQATLEQDTAAGGAELRKIRTKAGDVATISLAVSPSGPPFRVTLRFKVGGATVQRPVGTVSGSTRTEVLQKGWKLIREAKIVESNGWQWIVSTSSSQ